MPAFQSEMGFRHAAENKDLRLAYIGTHTMRWHHLAKIAMQIKPKGGTVCISRRRYGCQPK